MSQTTSDQTTTTRRKLWKSIYKIDQLIVEGGVLGTETVEEMKIQFILIITQK